ncbi:MAG: epoxyqueuosine reductase QueH [Candidatus Edwardsbacteria bacterium]|nr:epoxyqueuosine reductase QueH [Candidatus Edwardsbacteria bacterium]
MSRLLLHICCAPCLCYPHQSLSGEKAGITGFWFNPNIHPYQEYRARLASVRDFARRNDLKIIYRDEYPLEENLGALLEDRCRACYSTRLEATAMEAMRGKYDSFSTTLLYSIYQKHDMIKDLGNDIGKKYGVEFLYRDFRKGWDDGRARARELELYRQKYCGCIFSERDRYMKTKKKI